MRRRLSVLAIAGLAAVAACTNPSPKKHTPAVQSDASEPRSCREWTITTATLRCSADVMQGDYAAVNAKRIAAAEDKLSRYGPLSDDLCKDSGGARSTRDDAAAYARSDAATRLAMDKSQQGSAAVALCHDAVIKIVSRGEESGRGRKVLADLHPNADDTPKETSGD
ncbi:MAG TPA: hypothetical protein VGL66_03620 [Caulobacteraceae bacterium]|jgi:hypothetical protein